MIRFTLPYADPYLFPLVAVLACFGLVVIYRIDDDARARAGAVVRRRAGPVRGDDRRSLRDFRVLERYRYTIAAPALVLLLLPRVPGIGQQVNGAYLGVKLGPIAFQPAEFGKIAIVIFLAAYLRDTRQVLVQGCAPLPRRRRSRRCKHFGPLLVVWGAAMLMLVFIRDLGSSLMFFGGFLALLYVATNRLSFVTRRAARCSRSARGSSARTVGARARPHRHLAGPVRPGAVSTRPAAYQIAQSLFAQADGGLFGTGLRRGAARPCRRARRSLPGAADRPDLRGDRQRARARRRVRADPRLPAVRRARLQDRDARAATRSRKLLATGLTAVFALQVFVIVGGVTR